MSLIAKCILILAAAANSVPASSAQDALCTTYDGRLQAIAQGPRSITVYWKSDSDDVLFVDGRPCAELGCPVETVSGFSSCTLDALQPNTAYKFALGPNGPAVTETTWCELPAKGSYDLLVIGGSASGVSAAVAAARLGMKVAVVEETNRIGGMAVNGLGSTDIRMPSRANGFFEDFRRRIMQFYGEGNGLRYESRVALAVIKGLVNEHAGISLFLRCEAVEPIVKDRRVLGARVRDTLSGKIGILLARVTIDATPTADFAAACGCEFRVGREPRSPEEPHAGVIYFDNATQQILPGSTGEGDRKQQSYAYLMIWKDYGDAGAPHIDKPRFYDPETYRHSPEWTKTWNYTSGRLPNG
ncbi:MAG: FAD-dependent oxidoreductase, partial [Armatimonadota bacterium]